jgi:hypothetical protein
MRLQNRLAHEVVRGASLVVAASELEPTALRSCSAPFLARLQEHNDDRPLRECLAANLLARCLTRTERPEEALQLARRLEAELRTAFGRRPPQEVLNLIAQVETQAAARQERRAAAAERDVDQGTEQLTLAASAGEVDSEQ